MSTTTTTTPMDIEDEELLGRRITMEEIDGFNHPQQPTRKRLRFSEYSALVLTQPKTNQELKSVWFNKGEIEQFKINARLDAIHLRDTSCNKLMRVIAYSAATTGSPTENVKVRRREQIHGIEHLISPEVLKTLYTQRRKTIKRVLQVQEAQRRGIIDPALTTAKISEINSSFSKAWSSRITKFQHGESDRVESTARCA